MKAKSSPRMQVVKRDEKEATLTAFINTHIGKLARGSEASEDNEILVVALSTDSPVVRALRHSADEHQLSEVHIRLILANISTTDLVDDLHSLPAYSVNWARNARLLDAHEQLVISTTTSWTGDCMRREPAKRDAFECFADDCAETAAWARTSFERLWGVSVPLVFADTGAEADQRPELPVGAATNGSENEIVVGTRH